jgi:hypothetical protein
VAPTPLNNTINKSDLKLVIEQTLCLLGSANKQLINFTPEESSGFCKQIKNRFG